MIPALEQAWEQALPAPEPYDGRHRDPQGRRAQRRRYVARHTAGGAR